MWILTDVGDCFRGGGIENKELLAISKNIWYYLFKKNMIIFEYLPGCSIYTEWGRGFRQTRNPSEWKLNSNIFKKLCQIRGTQEKWICFHQECQTNFPHTCHWKSILLVRVNMLPRCPRLRSVYAFALTGRVLQRLIQDQFSMLIITPVWPGQPWFPVRLKMPVKTPILQLVFEDLRRGPAEKVNSLVMQNSFQLFLFLDNLRKNLLQKGDLLTLSLTVHEHVHVQSRLLVSLEKVAWSLTRTDVNGILEFFVELFFFCKNFTWVFYPRPL